MTAEWERIGRRLRLKDLHTLMAIAETGSMAKASARLALSQPAISKAVADMERLLGAPLLDRSSRGVELTESGRRLIARSRIIFDELQHGVQEIAQSADPTQGEIRIGTTEPITVLVSEAIGRLARKNPRISFEVTVGDTTSLVQALRERSLDVVVTRWDHPSGNEELSVETLFDAPLAVMADTRHPLARQKRLSLADLKDEAWTLSPPDSYLGRIVTKLFQRRRLEVPKAVVTTISVYVRLNLVATGGFITILPERMSRHRANRAWLRCLDVDLPDSTAAIAFVTVAKRQMSGAAKLFRGACREVAKDVAAR